MPRNSFKVSQSKVKLWRKCHYAAYLKYIKKLRRKRKSRPLMFGSMVHEMIEAHANGGKPFVVLRKFEKEQGPMFRSEREEYGEIIADVKCIMTEYFDYWDGHKDELEYIRMNKKSAEHTFEVEIENGIFAVGKIDAFANAKKLRWLVEHKSFGKRVPNEDHRWRNVQGQIYIRICEMLGLPPVDGVVWDYILSKPPSRPQLLKDGKLSKKMIVSLPSRVIETIEQHRLRVADYRRLVQAAEATRSTYFVRIFNTIRKKVVDQVFDDFVTTSLRMAERLGKDREMNIDRHCEWCEYEPLCRARLTGGDADFVEKKEYVVHVKETSEDEDRYDFEA